MSQVAFSFQISDICAKPRCEEGCGVKEKQRQTVDRCGVAIASHWMVDGSGEARWSSQSVPDGARPLRLDNNI